MAANYAVAPGAYLREWMEDSASKMTQQELANRLGISRKLVNGILCGRDPITEDTAIRLERVTGIPRDAWVRFESKYRTDLARLHDEESLARHVSEISPSVGKYLRDVGATTATKRAPGRLVSDLLSFVNCGTFEVFEDERDNLFDSLAALRESGKHVDETALMVWLAAGEKSDAYLQARSLRYDEKTLRKILPDLRARAARPDDTMVADLAELLRSAGVVYQFIPAPNKFPLHGVTRWTPWGVPVIQQTGRRKKDGFIIWTLFHEIGHVINDEPQSMSIDLEKPTSEGPNEKAANEFARKVLFGPQGMSAFHGLTRSRDIKDVARRIGVSPGVAVNEMHRKRMLDYNQCNDLLVDVAIPMVE